MLASADDVPFVACNQRPDTLPTQISPDAKGQRLFGAERYAGHATSAARAGQLRDPPVAERGDD